MYGKLIIGTITDCPVKGFRSLQINNLKVRWDRMNGKFAVISPKNIVLAEFKTLAAAKEYAKETHDFVRK